jgi:tetratricopeptide (TPR) repeat protein
MTKVVKVGRNDPCPCGSGKKFKKCCIGKIPPYRPATNDPYDPKQRADLLYNSLSIEHTVLSMGVLNTLGGAALSGQDPEAKHVRDLKDVLVLDPCHPYASMDLGLKALSVGDGEKGRMLLDQGSRSLLERCKDPKAVGDALGAYADRLMDRFEFENAIMLYDRLPNTARGQALDGKASCLAYLGRLDDALESSKAAVREFPKKPTYASNLGWIHMIRAEIREAREALDGAEKLNPKDGTTKGNLMICKEMSRKGAPKGWVLFLLKGIPRKKIDAAFQMLLGRSESSEDADALIVEYNSRLRCAFKAHLAANKDLAPYRKFDLHFTFEYFISEVWDRGYNFPLCSIERLVHGYADMMDRLVVRTSDVKKGLLDDVNEAVTEFYELIGSAGIVRAKELKKLREIIEEEYPGVLERMDQYNREGRGPGVTSEEKADARERIYPNKW